LKPLAEAVGPRMAWPGARVPYGQPRTDRDERTSFRQPDLGRFVGAVATAPYSGAGAAQTRMSHGEERGWYSPVDAFRARGFLNRPLG
jgi:hypothetical protein